ncbi:cupin domain-containing protein [Hoeflea sp. 108]|uniref:cupin domain-containing protein n=1 Tax=Hoeflea sp. 108 TaxID=1116369 RepID=UPI00037D2C01|nr:cupin domain-containing protein [Hoeflea sp. 108]
MINPQAVKVAQSIETHIDVFAPGGYGQKHGHMNSAVFFVLKGKGHDIHVGKRLDWETGDALIVENGCVPDLPEGGRIPAQGTGCGPGAPRTAGRALIGFQGDVTNVRNSFLDLTERQRARSGDT